MREAIRLATAAGQGREAALLYNNLGIALWTLEGPAQALEAMRAGNAFAQPRGLTEIAHATTTSTLDPLIDTGQLDEALEIATRTVDRSDNVDVYDQILARSAQARILTLRGQATQATGFLDWIEATARTTGSTVAVTHGLASSALAHAALEHNDHAAALLAEIASTPGTSDKTQHTSYLPAMVRAALAIGDHELALRLTSRLEPRTPYPQHALKTATTALTEARGDMQTAADGYADAAKRWEQFGVTPEHAHALQGHGRCLLTLRRPDQAAPILRHARELFTQLGATPAITETDLLLHHATVLSS